MLEQVAKRAADIALTKVTEIIELRFRIFDEKLESLQSTIVGISSGASVALSFGDSSAVLVASGSRQALMPNTSKSKDSENTVQIRSGVQCSEDSFEGCTQIRSVGNRFPNTD